MITDHRIIIGDSREMSEVADQSVHLIITSPPYWQLKNYGTSDQIGFNDSYEAYINNLNLVWSECYRVLYDGFRLCINIGDRLARSVYYGRYKVIPIRTEIIKFCETLGFDYMGAIIWQKPTTMNTTGGATVMGSFPYPRNGIIKIDYEFILHFKKPGDSPRVSKEIKEQSKLSKEEWNEYFSGHWNFNGEKQIQHLAMFPEELPKRLIKMFSFFSDTVLDPFLGSGTTILAAKNINRISVGYEINAEFLPIIKEKVGINQLSTLAKFEVFTQHLSNPNWETKIQKLPYFFHDPIKFDKKIDPKRMSFGSKIDQSTPKRDEYFSVRKIINPELLVLSNNVKVRLLGVKTKQETAQDAIKVLDTKLINQKVFLRFDNLKYDSNGNLLCYLYLKNKTFINAYLIKNKLVEVDTNFEFRYKEKFLKLGNEQNAKRMDIK
jgi:site-specific DNA-methyltransferase (adenine-specific)